MLPLPQVEYANTQNGVIAYQTFGNPANPAVMLIMGIGMQMIGWDDQFCKGLAQRGYLVIRQDHRDTGLSSKFHYLGRPNTHMLTFRKLLKLPLEVPYTLKDMAVDSVDVMDFLRLDKAHVVGVSMGGMITQNLVMHFPHRAMSFTSIMSTMEDMLGILHPANYLRRAMKQVRKLKKPFLSPTAQAMVQMLKPPKLQKEAYIEEYVQNARIYNGSVLQLDEERSRLRAQLSWERGPCPEGGNRQFAAVIAENSREQELAAVDVPGLVVHGRQDPLIPVQCAYDMSQVLKCGRLHIFEEMGHIIHPTLFEPLIDLLDQHFRASAS